MHPQSIFLNLKKYLIGLLLVGLLISTSLAFTPLTADQAFQLSVKSSTHHQILLQWKIAPGYYLYRDHIHVQLATPAESAKITWVSPPGLTKAGTFLGNQQVYESSVVLPVEVKGARVNQLALTIRYQGCAQQGFCYPPMTKTVTVTLYPSAQTTQLTELFSQHAWPLTLILFFAFGVLLSLTPCVLPLLPILSSLIVEQRSSITARRAFFLSLSYVVAIATTYAAAGVLAGLTGNYLQASLQNSWMLLISSAVFVLLALSLLGCYELRLPASWQSKLMRYRARGSYISVAVMGALSALMLSPCVTPPLIGALTYIANTGSGLLGGLALWMLGLGMGVPLLIVGTVAGKYLPQTGRWMNRIKIICGLLMLLMAAWLLDRVIPINPVHWVFPTKQAASLPEAFQHVEDTQDMERIFAKARLQHKMVLLDFYADWCLSCKALEKKIFRNPEISKVLSQKFILVRADVTANDAADRALERAFAVIAPPTILFFTPEGQELSTYRLVGFIQPDEFLKELQLIQGNGT